MTQDWGYDNMDWEDCLHLLWTPEDSGKKEAHLNLAPAAVWERKSPVLAQTKREMAWDRQLEKQTGSFLIAFVISGLLRKAIKSWQTELREVQGEHPLVCSS